MISNDIRYVGVNDHQVDLFEGQYVVPSGMAYNSYVVLDEKVAVMDTVDAHFGAQWLENIAAVLGDRQPDYLVVQHMEPDHSANIQLFLERYPQAALVGNAKTFVMMGQFFPTLPACAKVTVTDGQTLSLGKHSLTFVFAPMVHWPEVMVSYDAADKVLFSADGFGKYGVQVQKLLQKASSLEIETICPLHGPILKENLGHYLEKYDIWSSYRPEEKGIVIAYASIYGHTKAAAQQLGRELEDMGQKVVLHDLARDDMPTCVADAFRYDRLVLASVTYNGDIFPCMHAYLHALTERSYQNRTVAFLENGTWTPTAGKTMAAMLEKSKNITFAEEKVTLKSAMNEASAESIHRLAAELAGK